MGELINQRSEAKAIVFQWGFLLLCSAYFVIFLVLTLTISDSGRIYTNMHVFNSMNAVLAVFAVGLFIGSMCIIKKAMANVT